MRLLVAVVVAVVVTVACLGLGFVASGAASRGTSGAARVLGSATTGEGRSPAIPADASGGGALPVGGAVPIGGGATVTARAQAFFVDCLRGSDAAPGSGASPWRTLAAVNARGFAPGAVVHLKRGCTWDGGLTIRSSGVAGRPVTFAAYGSGALPTIRHTAGGTYASAIDVWGSYVVVDGLRARDASFAGVRLERGGSHNVVRNMEITATGFGVDSDGSANVITRNFVHDLRMILNTPGGNDDYGAVGYQVNGSGNEISYNRCLRCRASSYDYGADGGFVEVWNSGDETSVHHNFSMNDNGFFELGAQDASHHANNVRVAYNVIVNDGISVNVNHNNAYSISVSDFRFEHNTVVQTTRGLPQIIFPAATPEALIVRNNIFYLNGPGNTTWWGSGQFVHRNNVYYTAGGATVAYALGSGEKHADPKFADLSAGDYRLRKGSPADRAGLRLGYRTDYLGTVIPATQIPNVGAVNVTLAR